MRENPPIKQIARIEIDREICIGAASCMAVAPQVFELDAENKAVVRPNHGAPDDLVFQAAKACPVNAIRLYDEAGQLIYPQS